MSVLKLFYRVILLFLILFSCFFFLSLINLPNSANSYGSQLTCENTLKMIANAAKLYQDEWEGQWPPSLLEMGPYYEGTYTPAPNSVPKCPGGGSLSGPKGSQEYYYYPPKVKEVVPVCWDSKPHHARGVLLPDTFSSNVLYSDGHIERFSERELFRELFKLAKTNPDVLKVLNYPDTISYSRLTIFIIGIAIGLILALSYRFITKK